MDSVIHLSHMHMGPPEYSVVDWIDINFFMQWTALSTVQTTTGALATSAFERNEII